MANILLGYWYKLYISQTECERLVETEVAKLGIRYRTQHPFLGQKAFADFYFPDYKLILEIDDPSHDKPEKIQKDLQRTKSLEALGLRVIRVTNAQVRAKLPEVVALISRAIATLNPEATEPSSLQPEEPTSDCSQTHEANPSTPEPTARCRPRRRQKSSSKR